MQDFDELLTYLSTRRHVDIELAIRYFLQNM